MSDKSVGGAVYHMFTFKLNKLLVDNYSNLTDIVEPLAEKFVFLYVVIVGDNALKGNLGEWTKSAVWSVGTEKNICADMNEVTQFYLQSRQL